MNHIGTRIHVQIGFHRILPYMHFCLHGLSPVHQAGLDPWHAPLGRAHKGIRAPLATPTMSRSRTPKGAGVMGRVRGGLGGWFSSCRVLLGLLEGPAIRGIPRGTVSYI